MSISGAGGKSGGRDSSANRMEDFTLTLQVAEGQSTDVRKRAETHAKRRNDVANAALKQSDFATRFRWEQVKTETGGLSKSQ